MKQQASTPSCNDVLSAFAVEPTHDRSTLERYLREFPQYAVEIANLSHEISRPLAKDRELTPNERTIIDESWRRYSSSPSTVLANIFSSLSVPQLRALAETVGVKRQIITAFREQRVIPASIPNYFLSRLAAAMNATVEEIKSALTIPLSANYARCNKSEEKPVAATPVTFEQLLIEAEVPVERRAELMAEGD